MLKAILALLNLGLTSLLLQVVIIRQLVSSFYGNEFFLNLILGLWLISVGLGSLLLAQKIKFSLAIWHFALPFIYLFSFIFACGAKIVLKNSGIIPTIKPALLWSLTAIIPVGLSLGVLFVLLAQSIKKTSWYSAAIAYTVESLGFLIGAFTFNFWAYQLSNLIIVWLLSLLSLGLALFFAKPKARRYFGFALALFLLGAFFLPRLNIWLIQNQYAGKILKFANTKLGPVVITRQNQQKNFYHNGHLVFTSQNQQATELIVHLPLLLAKQTNNILVIGNLNPSLIKEIDKYQPQNLTLLELDKDYYHLINQNLISQNKKPPYVHLVFADARQFFSANKQNNFFDVIIINQSNPNTLADNRYFTSQAFAQAKLALKPGGLIAFMVNTTPNYTVGAQRQLLSAYWHTLKKEFNHILVLADNEVMFLASDKPIQTNYSSIKNRYQKLNLNNQFVTPQFVKWRLVNDRTKYLTDNLPNFKLINTDQRPLIWWLGVKIFLTKLKAQNLIKNLCFVLSVIIAVLLLFARFKKQKLGWLVISALPEAFLLCFEIILILWFEVKLGWLYTQLSLIIALILFGLSQGALASLWALKNSGLKSKKLLTYSYFLIFIAFLCPWLLINFFAFAFRYSLTFYLLACLAGFSLGTKFPLINKIYLNHNSNLGAVYGADLLGASLGALISVILLPAIGLGNILLILMLASGSLALGLRLI